MPAAGPPLTTGSTLLPRLLSMGQSLPISGWCHGSTVAQRASREPVSDKKALMFQLVPQLIAYLLSLAHWQLNNFYPQIVAEI